MSFGSIPFGHGTFAGTVYVPASSPPIGGEPEVQIVIDPFTIEISGQSMKGYQLVDSLSIDAELGRQASARFSLRNTWFVPQIGEPVRILYYSEVLFVGAIDRVRMESNNLRTFVKYDIDCTDNSYLLFRKKIKISLVNHTVANIANTIIASELFFDGVQLGTVDNNVTLPLADADGVSIFEFLSGVATATGLVFSIDHDRLIHFRGESLPAAIAPLDQGNVEQCVIEFDRETYRNKMTTNAIGTPADNTTNAVSIRLTRSNTEQIAVQASIEQNTGIYSDITSVTHPTSNDPVQLTRLANAYNKIQLGVSGSIRRGLSIRTRQYGYAAGQLATVDIPQLGVSGEWVIQRSSLREESGRFLISELELNQTSLIKRAQELWIDVVKKGSLTIMPPISVYTNISIQTTPGIGSFQVPGGVTEIQVSCYGGGGGGGGGAKSNWPAYGGVNTADGSAGGSGGLIVGVLPVTPGEVLTFWIGVGGSPGPGEYRFESLTDSFGGHGTAGIESYVKRGSTFLMRAYPGQGGYGGVCRSRPLYSNTLPAGGNGGGFGGQSATVGGAGNGGTGGKGATYSPGIAGGNGKVIFEW